MSHATDALEAAALAVSSAKGDRVFQELTRYLATILDVQLALVGRFTGESPRTVRTLGIYGNGSYRENFEYPLHLTPCREVVDGGFAVVARDVRAHYPDDQFLPRGAVGYAGYALKNASGEAVGVIATISRQPIGDEKLFESVLKIFAVRAAAELERRAHEEALAASEANYKAIFDATEDAIFVHDYETGAILDVNLKACATYGYTRDELRRLADGASRWSAPGPSSSHRTRWARPRAGGSRGTTPTAPPWTSRSTRRRAPSPRSSRRSPPPSPATDDWPWPLERDLRLHRLLHSAIERS